MDIVLWLELADLPNRRRQKTERLSAIVEGEGVAVDPVQPFQPFSLGFLHLGKKEV